MLLICLPLPDLIPVADGTQEQMFEPHAHLCCKYSGGDETRHEGGEKSWILEGLVVLGFGNWLRNRGKDW